MTFAQIFGSEVQAVLKKKVFNNLPFINIYSRASERFEQSFFAKSPPTTLFRAMVTIHWLYHLGVFFFFFFVLRPLENYIGCAQSLLPGSLFAKSPLTIYFTRRFILLD